MGFKDELIGRVGWLANHWDWLGDKVNPLVINKQVSACRTRPHPWSTAHDYVSWKSLTDLTYSGRHLPPDPESSRTRPPSEELARLFARPAGRPQVMSDKSTVLFPAFAQYLTDGFLRTRMPNSSKGEPQEVRLRNTSNHQIDLCPLYGNNEEQTAVLRLNSEDRGRRGRLKSQEINGEEWAPYLYLPDGTMNPEVMGKAEDGTPKRVLDEPVGLDHVRPGGKERLFAFGGDRANTMPHVAMFNTLFLREHNRLAGEIEAATGWDDERVFQTARNTLIVVFIQIVVEEYINHISSEVYRLKATPRVAWRAPWNRPNWMTTEFSLLYRWHSLVPDAIEWKGEPYQIAELALNPEPLVNVGLAAGFVELSAQKAGRLGALNSAEFLVPREQSAIDQGRLARLQPYAAYRKYMGMSPPKRFEDISTDPDVVAFLRGTYEGRVEDVEFYVGLFAEDPGKNTPLPSLIRAMVAVDAFSQAFTNPLLSEHVFKESTFSPVGWATINDRRNTLEALVRRNTEPGAVDGPITMTQPGWKRKR